MQHPSPGDFATIRYKWTNKAGEVTLAGTVDFTETLEAIAPQSSKTVLLPVNVPQAAGPYTLTVSFDNERLKPGFMTLGAIPPDYDQFRFVQVQDEVTLAPTTARDPVKQ